MPTPIIQHRPALPEFELDETWAVRCCTVYGDAGNHPTSWPRTWARELRWVEHDQQAGAVTSLAAHLADEHGTTVRTVTVVHVVLDPLTDVDVATWPNDASWTETHSTDVEVPARDEVRS